MLMINKTANVLLCFQMKVKDYESQLFTLQLNRGYLHAYSQLLNA